jgi:hypothetical protein
MGVYAIIPELGRQRQDNWEFKDNLGYIGKCCLNKRKRKERERERKENTSLGQT